MCHTQVRNFATMNKFNIYFYLPEFRAAKIITRKCHMDESAEGRYNIILGVDVLNVL